MSAEFDSNAEYLEANRSLIEDITGAIDSHLQTASEVPTLMVRPDQPDPVFIAGAVAAEAIIEEVAEVEGSITYEEAFEIAQTHNRTLMGRAALATVELQTAMTKRYIADRFREDPVSAREEPLELIPYSSATFTLLSGSLDDGSALSLRRTTMSGLKRYHEATEHVVETEEDGVTHTTAFLSTDQTPLFVFTHTDLSHDPLFYRAAMLLENSRPELGVLMSGSLKTEEEIGHMLALVEQQYYGSSKEAEVGPLLDEIFERAMSLRVSLDMQSEFDVSTPSVEQLEALRAKLTD